MLRILPLFHVALALNLVGSTAALICGGTRSQAKCCMGAGPYYSNAGVWGGVCGYYPSSSGELIGGRCITIASGTNCPSGSVPLCCAGSWPGQCGLGTNCEYPPNPSATSASSSPTSTISSTTSSASSLPSIIPAPLPDGWTGGQCSTDSGSRALFNVILDHLSNNTPANCIAHCSSLGYTFAGVSYGDECQCGTGLWGGYPDVVDQSQCNSRCSGDNRYTCGGSWRVQLYIGPPAVETLTPGWSLTDACAVDVPSRVIANDNTVILNNNTPATCIAYCAANGYTMAGVEYGNECHCGTGYAGGVKPEAAPMSDCSGYHGTVCAGSNGLYCGGSWRIQIYSSQ